MIDKEKVIKGLEACTAWNGLHQCKKCPYDDERDCKYTLMKDMLEFIRSLYASGIPLSMRIKEYSEKLEALINESH